MVDAAAFIDPVVPVDSAKSGGAVVKKGLRTLSLWYMGYVTHQVSQFATAVSRSLHLLDERVVALQSQLDAQEVPPAPVVEAPGWHNPDAWWVADALAALQPAPGRVLHAAAGDGWLVRVLTAKGVDAYGVDPRPETVDRAELDGTDLREEGVLEHLRAVEPSALGGVVLTGVVDPHDQRRASPAPRGPGRPPGPRGHPGGPLPLAGRLGRRRRPAGVGPGAGPAPAGPGLGELLAAARLHGHRARGPDGRPTTWPWPSCARPPPER